MSDSFKFSAAFLHGAAASIMAYGWFALQSLPISDFIHGQKCGHTQFLTIQGLAVAWLTMMTSLGCDLVPSLRVLKQAKRIMFMIAMPLAVVIMAVYWSLMLFMPSLILRKEHGEQEPTSSSEIPNLMRIPLRVDLALHAAPGLALLLDFFLFERRYSKKQARYGGAIVAALAGIWYASWVEHCSAANGTFPYPFLTVNPFDIRVSIYAGLTTFAYLFFLAINAIHA